MVATQTHSLLELLSVEVPNRSSARYRSGGRVALWECETEAKLRSIAHVFVGGRRKERTVLNHYKMSQFNLAVWPASLVESEYDWESVQEDLQFEGIAMHNCGTTIGAQEVWAEAEQLKENEAIASYVNNVEAAKSAREELKSRFLELRVDHSRDSWRVIVDRSQCQLPKDSVRQLCQLAAAVAAGESYRVYCWVDGDNDSLDPTIDHGYAVPEWISFYEVAPELAEWFGTAVAGESVELVEYDEEISDYDGLLDVWSVTGFDPLQGALF